MDLREHREQVRARVCVWGGGGGAHGRMRRERGVCLRTNGADSWGRRVEGGAHEHKLMCPAVGPTLRGRLSEQAAAYF